MTQALYKCSRCKIEFEAMHFSEFRLATGQFLRHECGEVASWIKNIEVDKI
jgi:hypothetical protein